MTHGSLFSGIGGFDLAAHWAGIPTLWQVEKDDYCRAVLRKNFPETTRYEDIKNVGSEELEPVSIISGGFPCQPFSVAGKQRGKTDDRYLWPEMLRVIAEVRPTWVIAENVAGIIRMELDSVLASLEAEGYTAWPLVIPACGVGARHRRNRVWILANANGESGRTLWTSSLEAITTVEIDATGQQSASVADAQSHEDRRLQFTGVSPDIGASSQYDSDSERSGLEERNGKRMGQEREYPEPESVHGETIRRLGNPTGETWAVEPDVGRVAHGIPRRVDRLKGLGNAIVPQVAYQIFKAIREVA